MLSVPSLLLEAQLARPSARGLFGHKRQAMVDLRSNTIADLEQVDSEIAELITRRRVLAERIDKAAIAIIGTRVVVDDRTGQEFRLSWRAKPAFDDPLPANELTELRGQSLRVALRMALEIADQAVSVSELTRLLAHLGVRARGRPSQTISNALRPLVESGTVRRPRRGMYQAVDIAEPSPVVTGVDVPPGSRDNR